MYISEKLAAMIKKLALKDIPQQVRETARSSIIDGLGVALAGAAEPASRHISAYVQSMQGIPECTIIAGSHRAPAAEAALVNATTAHALDFDDSTDTVGGHPTTVILPAVLAIGEKLHASGERILTAYIAGFETEALLAKMVNFEHYDKGWHPTATLGVFGSAAACAKLMELDESETAMGLSLAVSMACGVKENFGTMTKPLQAGLASRNGLTAASLAAQGFIAQKSAIEGKKGFFEVFNGAGKYRIEDLGTQFGCPWDLAYPGVAIKQYPCCGSTHPAIDAVIQLVTENDLSPDEIATIHVATHPRRLAHTNRPLPQTNLEAKFSVQYVTAVAAANRWVGLGDFMDGALQREAVRKLLLKTEACPLPEHKWGPEHFAAEVDIRCSDGRRLHRRVEKAKGRGPQLTLSAAELERKFSDCASRQLSPEAVRSCLAMVAGIEELTDIGMLMGLLSAGQTSR